ncbi:MAG: hypothetical protein H6737_06575 [Alphaproteobacteria bacterium]|nr:hypothetical protein [Alphaproteobacteria bacterium]
MSTEPQQGLNRTQAWAAGTALLLSVLLVVLFRMPVLLGTADRSANLGLEVYRREPVGLVPIRGRRVEVGDVLSFRVRTNEAGYLLVLQRPSTGGAPAVAVHPDDGAAFAVEPGLHEMLDVHTVDAKGHWTLTAVLCTTQLVFDPADASALWSCQTRDYAYPVD